MNSGSLFLSNVNITILFDVISNDKLFLYLNPQEQHEVHDKFISELQTFYNTECNASSSTCLSSLNKKYILRMVTYIRNTYSVSVNPLRIDSTAPVPIPIHDVKKVKDIDFDKRLTIAQNEFNIFDAPKPPSASFVEEADRPLENVDKLIEDMKLKRQYDVFIPPPKPPSPSPSHEPTISTDTFLTRLKRGGPSPPSAPRA